MRTPEHTLILSLWRMVLQFSSMLHVARYPYIGLLSGSGNRIKRVACSEGFATPADLMQVLRPAVEQHGAQLWLIRPTTTKGYGVTLFRPECSVVCCGDTWNGVEEVFACRTGLSGSLTG